MKDKYDKIAEKFPRIIHLSPRASFEKQIARFLRKHSKGLARK